MPIQPWIAVPLCVVALAGATGCTFTHRCTLPDPVVEAAPASGRIPLTVAVRYAPAPAPILRQQDPYHRWIVDPAPAMHALFDRLVASMFERTLPASRPGEAALLPDAELEVTLDRLRFAWGPFGPYRAAVTYRATLRAADGTEIAAFDAAGSAERPLGWELATHCKGIGDSVALAMQDAGTRFLGKFASDPAVAAWFRGRAVPLPALAVRDPGSYPREVPAARTEPVETLGEPRTAAAATLPSPEPMAAPAAAPVRPPSPMPPHSFQLRVTGGVFVPDETAGRLENGSKGVSLTLVGAEYRPRRALGIELELGEMLRTYSGRTLPPAGAFAVRSAISLQSQLLGVGVRAVLPGRRVEPWVGVTGHVIRTEMCASYSLFGLSGCSEDSGTEWSVGADVGAGIAVFFGARWFGGIEVRRLFARASVEPLSGAASIGGVSVSGSLGAALP